MVLTLMTETKNYRVGALLPSSILYRPLPVPGASGINDRGKLIVPKLLQSYAKGTVEDSLLAKTVASSSVLLLVAKRYPDACVGRRCFVRVM
uniref:Uncharacterized protein n=1 Tax=Oryza brachyantha TaxID=4533 RepID=J3KU80_ORYBR